jgi:hypothetical protein
LIACNSDFVIVSDVIERNAGIYRFQWVLVNLVDFTGLTVTSRIIFKKLAIQATVQHAFDLLMFGLNLPEFSDDGIALGRWCNLQLFLQSPHLLVQPVKIPGDESQ